MRFLLLIRVFVIRAFEWAPDDSNATDVLREKQLFGKAPVKVFRTSIYKRYFARQIWKMTSQLLCSCYFVWILDSPNPTSEKAKVVILRFTNITSKKYIIRVWDVRDARKVRNEHSRFFQNSMLRKFRWTLDGLHQCGFREKYFKRQVWHSKFTTQI